MVFLILFVVGIVLGLCVTKGNAKKGLLGAIAALLFFPIGVIFSLTKKYK